MILSTTGYCTLHMPRSQFSIRACDLFPGRALQCKETFSLLFYEFDAATREPPPWEPESYKLIDR